MADAASPPLGHLAFDHRSIQQEYAPRRGRSRSLQLLLREREEHGRARLAELERLDPLIDQRRLARLQQCLADLPDGITIEFRSSAGFDLAYERLDLKQQRIELLNVRQSDGVWFATVFVPAGKLHVLKKRVSDYLTQTSPTSKTGRPSNADLIESIDSIGVATLAALWTDEESMPEGDETLWWEVWIRLDDMPAAGAFLRFQTNAERLGLHVAEQRLAFPERVVATVRATRLQLTQAIELLNLVAEVRHADRPPLVSHEMTLSEQEQLAAGIGARVVASPDGVAVAILDTGVARAHPLLKDAVAEADMHTVDETWGKPDHHGHGTAMAGLVLYGDLRDHAVTEGPILLPCLVESVKAMAPEGMDDERVPLGAICQQASYLCEIVAPLRKRVFCQALTSSMHRSGDPSSYSSAIDQLAYGDGSEEARLIIVSAGNVPDAQWLAYPTANYDYGIEQPGQAWNALTVGAYTERDGLPATADYSGWSSLAARGDVSPFSSTSRSWSDIWPIKPEVLFEGGNAAVDGPRTQHAMPDSLQLLTTARNHTTRPLRAFSMTSAAAALAARFGAQILSRYPNYWPETVRALAVHCADWTEAQRAAHLTNTQSRSKRAMLRSCGYGVCDADRALNSTQQRVTLVTQETLQPYMMREGRGRMNELRMFELPWPHELLEQYYDTEVELRITLSYFIEPNPSQRGWASKYRYASHGLRFELQRLNESPVDFARRTNEAMNRLETEDDLEARPDSQGWLLGDDLRRTGSIHSDRWRGPAIELATRNLLAVHPIVGWWRERKQLGRVTSLARFALVVSLDFGDVDVPLYTAIENELRLEPQLLGELQAVAEANALVVT